MTIRFLSIPTDHARALQAGGPDAHGQIPQRRVSDGDGVPCRHCLRMVPAGQPYLLMAYKPFTTVQPYAEVGPIFLCASDCASGSCSNVLPAILCSDSYIVRGYDRQERIVPGTGRVTPRARIISHCKDLLARGDVAFVHVRSATNTCFHVRVERTVPAEH